MKVDDLPEHVYVVFTDNEWSVQVVVDATSAIVMREKRLASGNVSGPSQVHVYRARLSNVTEMGVVPGVPAVPASLAVRDAS